jgi:hypothetical protein
MEMDKQDKTVRADVQCTTHGHLQVLDHLNFTPVASVL